MDNKEDLFQQVDYRDEEVKRDSRTTVMLNITDHNEQIDEEISPDQLPLKNNISRA